MTPELANLALESVFRSSLMGTVGEGERKNIQRLQGETSWTMTLTVRLYSYKQHWNVHGHTRLKYYGDSVVLVTLPVSFYSKEELV